MISVCSFLRPPIVQAVVILLAWATPSLATPRTASAPPCGSLSRTRIQAAVDELVASARAALPDGAELRGTDIEVGGCSGLPRHFARLKVERQGGHRLTRSLRASLILRDGSGRTIGRAWLRMKLDVRVPTVITTRPIHPGESLSSRDLRVALRPLSPSTRAGRRFSTVAVVAGLRARHDLAADAVVRVDDVDRPLLVERGMLVEAQIQRGPLVVTSRCVALHGGREGDTIRVRQEGGGKTLVGKVVAPGAVRIMF